MPTLARHQEQGCPFLSLGCQVSALLSALGGPQGDAPTAVERAVEKAGGTAAGIVVVERPPAPGLAEGGHTSPLTATLTSQREYPAAHARTVAPGGALGEQSEGAPSFSGWGRALVLSTMWALVLGMAWLAWGAGVVGRGGGVESEAEL